MITDESVNINEYRVKILAGFHGGEASRGKYMCENPRCRCQVFYRHGIYERFVVELSDEALEKSSLEDLLSHFNDYCHRIQILRVVCRDCGRTHAILPSDVIPFHQISMVLMMSLFMMIRLNDKSSEQRIRVPQSARGDEDLYQAVSWQYLHALFQILQQYLPRMIAALRQSLIYTQSVDPRADELLRIYLDGSHPSRTYLAYLRLFRCPLFVSRRNTVTYPLRYIVSGIG